MKLFLVTKFGVKGIIFQAWQAHLRMNGTDFDTQK
jgi:hypothetical protein